MMEFPSRVAWAYGITADENGVSDFRLVGRLDVLTTGGIMAVIFNPEDARGLSAALGVGIPARWHERVASFR